MIRNLKALGLALFAILAMGAMAAASASAQEGEIYSTTTYPAHISGSDVDPTGIEPTAAFTRDGDVIECDVATYTSEIKAAVKRLTITPKYEKCEEEDEAGGLHPVTVTVNGCDYEFHHATTLVGGTTDQWTVTADLKCPTAKGVEVHTYNKASDHTAGASHCTLTMLPASNQNLAGGLITEETGATDPLEIEGTVKPQVQTHGTCSFGFTLNVGTELHLSATVTGSQPIGIKHG